MKIIVNINTIKDMDTKIYIDKEGNEQVQSTLSKKLINMTLVISMLALVVSTIICISAISSIRTTAVEKSMMLGQDVADVSEMALLAEAKLKAYISSAQYASEFASTFG